MTMKSTLSFPAALLLMPLAGLHAAGQQGRPADVPVAQIREYAFPSTNRIQDPDCVTCRP
jgi:hypothetical protein